MRKFIRGFVTGFFIVAFLVVWTWFMTLQVYGGGYAYQVQDGRVKWAIVVCIPGNEQFYDHETNKLNSHFRFSRRLRISPWFDNGPLETTPDNP